MRRNSPWIHYARFDCVLDLRMDHRQGRLVGGLEMSQMTLSGFTTLEKRINKLEAYVETLAKIISELEMKE